MTKIRILVVEDEIITAEDIRFRLQCLGYDVTAIVSTGEQAFIEVEKNPPDLALMDIKLHGRMNGIGIAQQLRTRFNIPVVFLTAFADRKTVERVKVTEPYGFILKPFEDNELQGVIETAIYKFQMEIKLNESEEKFETIFNSAADGIMYLDNKLTVLEINPAFSQITGIPREEVVGKNGFDLAKRFIKAKDLPGILQILKKLLSKVPIGPYELEFQDKFLEIHTKIDKELPGNTTIYRDITERKRAEEERLSHMRFLEHMDRIDRVIREAQDLQEMMGTVLDTVLSIFHCDRAWLMYPCDPHAKTWNIPMERTTSKYPGAYERGRDFPVTSELAESFRVALKSDGPLVFHPEFGLPLPDSAREFSIKSSLNSVLYPKIERPWLWGISQCSHPRIWSESDQALFREIGHRIADALSSFLSLNQLQESEEKFRNAFEYAVIGRTMVNPQGCFIKANETFCQMIGFPEKSLLKKSWIEITYPDDLDRVSEFMKQVMVGEVPSFNDVHRLIRKNGRVIWVDFNVVLIRDVMNNPLYMICDIVDITERKVAEERDSLNNAHIMLVNDLNAYLSLKASLDDLIKKACDGLKKIHRLNFADFLQLITPHDAPPYLEYRYTNMNKNFISAVEKLTNVKIKNYKIPLFPGGLYDNFQKQKQPVEFIGKEQIATAIADMAPPEKIFLRQFAPQVAAIVGSEYMYIVPLLVRGESIGEIGLNKDDPFNSDEKAAVNLVIGQLANIFERKITEEQIQKDLREKEVMLKEIHHRVKNNLQVISSLLSLQSDFIQDERFLEIFKESQNRIRSMALVHEELYSSQDLSSIELNKYVAKLVSYISNSYTYTSKYIYVNTHIGDITLTIELAIPIGLIINELLSNALKHAFPPSFKSKGEVDISLIHKQKKKLLLTVQDNGIGLPEDFDCRDAKTLGMRLIYILAEDQLEGKVKVVKGKGTKFQITLKYEG